VKTNQVILACQHFCEKKIHAFRTAASHTVAIGQTIKDSIIRNRNVVRSESLAFKGVQHG
jgi:hypothetical protein